ncbi:DNA polymerase III subunit gamma/tau [Caulobacter sp. S45]|uniref:DNA polymerase III subunit gamma/tau n=1 Tax=Caulobacter sp. S45 TaxID=1641861 RepID=UPI00131E0953|nr:DNA polymerase III subunit gamma/tau [Caulobacter sp. S45]
MTDADLDLDTDLDPIERDPDTSDMFGGAPAPVPAPPAPVAMPANSPAYQVLARKYRPRRFEDLIGQEAMVRTLGNAFTSGRIAHAYMLTGVRGVGKTTTARLLARALNYESETIHQPTIDLSVDGVHCRAIIEGRHMDVLELDAASRTKVDEMRELLDGVRYAPVEARYKVYVIDEVHMLSTAAFNALLKTLEEPPPHAKFIFATTEIRKVPVTILSRCQRFDLRRVEPDVLGPNLARICEIEGARIEPEALALIARAAEGSVRDGQSLLDQAMVQAERGELVTTAVVRDMLGLADRGQTIALFEAAMHGKAADALQGFRTLYGFGADPAQVMLDLLEHAHGSAVARTLGPDALGLPSEQAARLAAVGAQMSAGALSRVWQMLLKAHEEVRRAPQPAAAAEMALIRLCYAADLPGPEEALKAIQRGEGIGGGAPVGGSSSPAPSGGGLRAVAGGGGQYGGAQPSVRAVTQPEAAVMLQTFEDVVKLIDARRDVTLMMDVQRYVRLVDFKPGVISFEPAPGAPANLSQRLSAKLREWTGQRWMMDLQVGGGETAYEKERRAQDAARAKVTADPFVVAMLDAFPGVEIVNMTFKPIVEAVEPAPDEDAQDD